MKSPVSSAKDGIRISLHVQPGASKSEWAGIVGDALKLRIAARPVEGEANKAVCKFLADFFAVPKSAVSIIHGLSGRNKTVHVSGSAELLLAKLQSLIAGQDT